MEFQVLSRTAIINTTTRTLLSRNHSFIRFIWDFMSLIWILIEFESKNYFDCMYQKLELWWIYGCVSICVIKGEKNNFSSIECHVTMLKKRSANFNHNERLFYELIFNHHRSHSINFKMNKKMKRSGSLGTSLSHYPHKTIMIVIYLFLLRCTVEWFLSFNPFCYCLNGVLPSNIISRQLFVINVASLSH